MLCGNIILFSMNEGCVIRIWATKEVRKGKDSKAENAKENFTAVQDILRVVLYLLNFCELVGISCQKAKAKWIAQYHPVSVVLNYNKIIRHLIKSDIYPNKQLLDLELSTTSHTTS